MSVSGRQSTRITTGTTTAVKATAGRVVRVIVEAAATGTVTFNDSLGARLILPIAFPAGSFEVDIEFAGKIEVVTSAADRVVVVWQ
jgi:hypothetical protein